MKKLFLCAGIAVLAACGGQQATAPEADEADVEAAVEVSLAETTWTYTQDGKEMTTSIDGAGNYDTNSGTEHVDHGTIAMVDGRACFTSAMNEEGPECWTVAQTEIGQSMESTSDKGNSLTVTRREYVPFEVRS